MDIGPGDWVEFIGKPEGYVSPAGGLLIHLEIGRLYMVSEVGRRLADGAGVIWPSLRLVGQPTIHPRTGRPCSTPVAAFRPIYRPRPGAFSDLLKTPDRVEEAA